jgi:DNA mismatch repair ATPase MutS
LRVIAFYERGLARLEDRWIGTGEAGERFLESSPAYLRDLDLFGKGSLYELLCTARTSAGEESLARWLTEPAPPGEVYARQAAITDLRGRLNLREHLAMLEEAVRSGVRPAHLAAWGEGDSILTSVALRVTQAVLAGLWLLSLVVWIGWGLRDVALVSSVVNLIVTAKFHKREERIVNAVEDACHDLALLSTVLEQFETERFSAPKLIGLQTGLKIEGITPSRAMARLDHLAESLESRRNPFLRLVDPFVFWNLQFAFAVEAWRKKYGHAVRGWLAAVGEMEALCALAGYSYEHPSDVFPEFTEESPLCEAAELAHPLISENRAVRNDLRLGGDLRLMVISGPNMAGKSTFVRAVGINAVLAQCGAPVRARRLRLSRLAVAASICILDSLQGGVSHFYAEIARLKQITDLTGGPLPVLFLLDELLQGTNSHDRRIGAEAVVPSLVERGAIGLITTHDLALAQIGTDAQLSGANFHFEDHLENGELRFDYRLTPGVVQTSNALRLMRSIGLKV